MTTTLHNIDAHAPPSQRLRSLYKRISKADPAALEAHATTEIDDVRSPAAHAPGSFIRMGTIPRARRDAAFAYLGVGLRRGGDEDDGGGRGSGGEDGEDVGADEVEEDAAPIFAHARMPGLLIVPGLLPPEVQTLMLDRIMHRDLSVPTHLTNLHPHYKLPYRQHQHQHTNADPDTYENSFFSYPPDGDTPRLEPLDPSVHKPLSMRRALERSLNWVTLGGQYDWTARTYPAHDGADGTKAGPPAFPADLAGLLRGLFPETDAQAAIVNVYGASSTMMMHRDVSEEADRGLISLSFGCDGLFMTCPEDIGDQGSWGVDPASKIGDIGSQGEERGERKYLLLRLRSGDAVYMTKEARCAWHGVPRILAGTCPDYLADWPARRSPGGGEAGEDADNIVKDRFEAWRGWMSKRRINFNVRQMKE